jgi:Fe-S-cluster containining protein
MPTIIRQEGFPYAFDADACATCGGRCCTGESGNIFVKREEIIAIADSLGMEVEAFMAAYLEKRGYKYSIKERIVGLSHDCIFYNREAGGCDIYTTRPLQCRTFPFWDYYRNRVDELKRECPGIIDD